MKETEGSDKSRDIGSKCQYVDSGHLIPMSVFFHHKSKGK